jgi:predicted Zn-dependent peptidase
MKTYMNDNSLPYYMTKSESRGLGFDYIFTSESELKKITPEDIKRVANKYFNNTAVFVSVPNEDVKLMVD